ncbi:glycerol-3-phosphate dehydrogenase/oxidase [Massilia sp. NP310]|uniref:glycerol-3-phosphate dehydrogenase/oxidase n=1 Tax=Massilia sp. NP310 TaxID=2861282 RepID=UPI001C635402|nr:glycerol-3-phosphate dehydrogenase/oxidase [Massilia sp. NP310]QYG03554.1 glycerol-3-phosphate dehydrogenase/oxidase [Massilia sp. NP310]
MSGANVFPPGRDWDLLVIGGGITGAGILLEAARRGLKTLLVEQKDFAWGTSSRSSKLVHGGLRYLASGNLRLTRDAVRERESLLRAAPGLVEPQGFAFADHGTDVKRRLGFLSMLRVYDVLAGRREPHWERPESSRMPSPNSPEASLAGGIRYTDAKTDDARLVLRVIDEARAHGAVACNYVTVQALVRDGGKVHGAMLRDERSQAETAVRARVVVNATGAWSDLLGGAAGGEAGGKAGGKAGSTKPDRAPRLRPLRGSHLVLPARRLPLAQAVSLLHPADSRPVFAFPWEGVTLVGTDADHEQGLNTEPRITRPEFDYLMAALHAQFPQLGLSEQDVVATFAGVRPVIDGGQLGAPSSEKRDHFVWSEPGLVSVAGGKLTTFRAIALDVLRHVSQQLPGWQLRAERGPVFARVSVPARHDLPPGVLRRLAGRYGAQAKPLLLAARKGELECIPGTQTLWAELRWAARSEQVYQLDDLLLRRTRLGIQLPNGGLDQMTRIRAICQPELGWDDARWEAQERRYLAEWGKQYGVPPVA